MTHRTRLALVAAALLAAAAPSAPAAAPTDAAEKSDVVAALGGYTTWSRATREPFLVSPAINAACAPAVPARAADPHAGAYITVFVNDAGRAAMFATGEVAFPEGSVIVKEKRAEAADAAPLLMTVMVKRARGYDPANGDWEFAVVDGTGSRVREQGRLASCASCHASVAKTDHVFRSYLSGEATETDD